MTVMKNCAADFVRSSYEIAWQKYCSLPGLMPGEKMSGPNKLRWYIQVMAEVGERDPSKIAKSALGMIREYEQIRRSKARVAYSGVYSEARRTVKG
jgi:hypothetical protein